MASWRSASGTAARAVIACQTASFKKLPSSSQVSDPSVPLGRRAIRTPPSSTWEMSSVVCSPPTTARTNGRSRKARSLLTSGPTAWARAASLSAAYHCQKPPRPSGSSRPLVQRARKISSESSRGLSVSVACPRRSRVRQLAGIDDPRALGDIGWEPLQEVEGDVTVGLDEDRPEAVLDGAQDDVLEEGRLPSPVVAEDVDVSAQVRRPQRDTARRAVVGVAEDEALRSEER